MKIYLTNGLGSYQLNIARPDKMVRQVIISLDQFEVLWEIRNQNRLYAFPVGDFEELALVPYPYIVRPESETEDHISATSEGIVWEINDYILGKMARSKAIPWEFFGRQFSEKANFPEMEL